MYSIKKSLKKLFKIEIFILIIILLFGLFLLYSKVITSDEVIIPGDIPYNTPVWAGYSPNTEYYKVKNYLLSDQISQFYPWHHLASQSMQENGKIPSWNPYEFAGQPLIANSQSALFYPPNLLLFFFSPGKVATVRAIFNILIAGIFMFLLARTLGISRKGSTLASIALAFSGPITVWLGHPHINVFVWLPYLIWTAEKLIITKKQLFWGLISSLGIGLSILGGHPETTFHICFAFSSYLVLRILYIKKKKINIKKIIIGFLIAVFVGGLIGSVQLIPFTEFLLDSATLSSGGRSNIDGSLFYGKNFAKEMLDSITLLFPNFFGNPVDQDYYHPFGSNNYNEQSIYFGLIPLMLAFGTLFIPGKPTILKIFIFLAIINIAIAWRLPFFDIINHLPVFSIVSNGRMKMVFTFFTIIIAGFGFDYYKRIIEEKKNKRAFYAMLAIPIISVFTILIISILKSIVMVKILNEQIVSNNVFSYKNHLILNIFSYNNLKTMISIILAISILTLFLLSIKNKINNSIAKNFMVVEVFIELIILAWGFNPTMKEKDILPESPVISFIKKDKEPYRMITIGKSHFSNYNLPHKIFHLGGYDLPVFQSYSDVFLKSGGKNIHAHSWNAESNLIDFLNVKYILATKKTKVPDRFLLKNKFIGVDLYENPNVMQRMFMTYDFIQDNDKDNSLKGIINNKFDLSKTILLSDDIPTAITQNLLKNKDKKGKFKITYIDYKNDSIKIKIETSKGGFLNSSEIFTNGWKAKINYIDTKIYKSNYAFRSIFVPSGKHTIEFYYDPLTVKIGKVLTSIGLILFIIGIIYFGLMKPKLSDSFSE